MTDEQIQETESTTAQAPVIKNFDATEFGNILLQIFKLGKQSFAMISSGAKVSDTLYLTAAYAKQNILEEAISEYLLLQNGQFTLTDSECVELVKSIIEQLKEE